MSPQLAKIVFNSLYEAILQNGFQDVGTELIQKGNDEEDYTNDTVSSLDELYQKAQDPNKAVASLRELSQSLAFYLQRASSLPKLFNSQLVYLNGTSQKIEIPEIYPLLFKSGEETIDIAKTLNNPDVERLTTLLFNISESIDRSDDEFFSKLNDGLR